MPEKVFLRIGNITIPISEIEYIDHNVVVDAYQEETNDYKPIHFVRISTRRRYYDYEHGTEQADALIAWLAPKSEVLSLSGSHPDEPPF